MLFSVLYLYEASGNFSVDKGTIAVLSHLGDGSYTHGYIGIIFVRIILFNFKLNLEMNMHVKSVLLGSTNCNSIDSGYIG